MMQPKFSLALSDLVGIVVSQPVRSLFPNDPARGRHASAWAELPDEETEHAIATHRAVEIRVDGVWVPLHRVRHLMIEHAHGRNDTAIQRGARILYDGEPETAPLRDLLATCEEDACVVAVRVDSDLSEHDAVTIDVCTRLRQGGHHDAADDVTRAMRPDSPEGHRWRQLHMEAAS